MKRITTTILVAVTLVGLWSFGIFEPIKGNWSSGSQAIRFGKGNQCQWILRNGDRSDTFNIPYHYEKTGKHSGILDLGPFDRGMLKGRTLYGIVEWNDKRSEFRYDAEPGKKASVRPSAINPEQVQVYKKSK